MEVVEKGHLNVSFTLRLKKFFCLRLMLASCYKEGHSEQPIATVIQAHFWLRSHLTDKLLFSMEFFFSFSETKFASGLIDYLCVTPVDPTYTQIHAHGTQYIEMHTYCTYIAHNT